MIPIEHRDHKINVLDAPGYTDFVGEVISALSVSDGAVVLVDSVAGLEVGTEIAWRYADEFNLPRVITSYSIHYTKLYEGCDHVAILDDCPASAMSPPQLFTDRLLLRPFCLQDAGRLLSLLCAPAVARGLLSYNFV